MELIAPKSMVIVWILGLFVFLLLIGVLPPKLLKAPSPVMYVSLGVFVLICGILLISVFSNTIKIQENTINIAVFGFYKLSIPTSERHKFERVENINNSDLRPVARTNGVGLPGYQAGWFDLQNGDRAFVYLTDRKQVSHLAKNENRSFHILLSARD